jgi:hypothetical protein
VVLVSTGASTVGNAGARWFASRFSGWPIAAAVSLDDPAGAPGGLHVWDDGQDGRRSIPVASAAEQAAARADAPVVSASGPFPQMASMAMPQTSGDQAAYIALGIPAVSLASRPEGPATGGGLPAEDSLGDAGRTAETLIASLDEGDALPAPAAGVIINGRELRPVMSRVVILLLALPLLVAALDLAVRLRRAGVRITPFVAALLWRFVPVVVALLVAHLLATAGMIAPAAGGWPPLAEQVPFDLAAMVAIVLSVGAGVLAWLAVRHRATRRDAEVASRAATGVIALGVVCVLLWLASPFGLLVALPAAHAALVATRARRPWQVLGLALVAAAPAVLLTWWVAGRIDRGIPYSAWSLIAGRRRARDRVEPRFARDVAGAAWARGIRSVPAGAHGGRAHGPSRSTPPAACVSAGAARMMASHRLISVVIPVFDERDSLEELAGEVLPVMRGNGAPFEVIFVDDGSRDGGDLVLADLARRHDEIRVVRLRSNFGKGAALTAGFREARGEVVITIDADLQDDPAEIPRLLAALDDGADLVSGWKQQRNDPWNKTVPSRVFNGVARRASGVDLHDLNCGFKAYRADVVRAQSRARCTASSP